MDFCLIFSSDNLRALWEGLSPEVGGRHGEGRSRRGAAVRSIAASQQRHACAGPAGPLLRTPSLCTRAAGFTPARPALRAPFPLQERELFPAVWRQGEDEWEPYLE